MNSRRQLSTSANGLVPGEPRERGFMNLANPTQPAGGECAGKGNTQETTKLASPDVANAEQCKASAKQRKQATAHYRPSSHRAPANSGCDLEGPYRANRD
jgi:hypothetical protein